MVLGVVRLGGEGVWGSLGQLTGSKSLLARPTIRLTTAPMIAKPSSKTFSCSLWQYMSLSASLVRTPNGNSGALANSRPYPMSLAPFQQRLMTL